MLLKNKRGQTNIVQSVFILLIVLFSGALIVIGLFAGANAIKASSLFTANSQADNDTDLILDNITAAGTSFFGNTGTFVSILVVVVIFGFIALLILAARRFGGGGGRGTVG